MGHPVDARRIVLDEPIKALGVYPVQIKLTAGVMAEVKVWVCADRTTEPVVESLKRSLVSAAELLMRATSSRRLTPSRSTPYSGCYGAGAPVGALAFFGENDRADEVPFEAGRAIGLDDKIADISNVETMVYSTVGMALTPPLRC